MAVATPVLERRISGYGVTDYAAAANTDEAHNARIKDNYARLINPDTKLDEIMGREEIKKADTVARQPVSAHVGNESAAYAQSVASTYNQPGRIDRQEVSASAANCDAAAYLVTGARADSEIFRADSAVNRRLFAQPVSAVSQPVIVSEDENEDLRPTATTIQYRSAEQTGTNAVIRPVTKSSARVGKREKIIIGAFVGVVVALFTLVIINSAIISGLNNAVDNAENSFNEVQSRYNLLQDSIDDARSPETVYQFAEDNGMIFVGTDE